MKRKYRGYQIFIFFILLAVLVAGFSAFIRPIDYQAYDILAVKRKVQAMESEPENSLDVLFLGDSESCDVYSPVQLYGQQGFTSYNTGSRAQRITDSYAILEEELKRQSPKVVVLEVNTLFTQDTLYNTSDQTEAFVEKLIPMVHYHSFYKQLAIPELISGMNAEYAKASVLKGFWYRSISVPYTGRKDYMKSEVNELSISDETKEYLEKITSLVQEKGIQLVLVSSPSPKNWTEGKNKSITEWAIEHDVPFLDLNEKLDEIGIDWSTDTRDGGDHVNFSGTMKINGYIGSYLKETYQLVDHRRDNTYQSWSDLYASSKIYTTQS